ncbi:MAG: GH32 C-terminal domain-containing protein, partial [Muribaculaceae bacterium]|nr:GH32 C-terminal domain-containing protein [Muribaculaceae bacterium]
RLWMRQTPLKAIDSLRQKPVKMNRRLRAGMQPLAGVGEMGNVYELKIRMAADRQDVAGISLCEGGGRRVTVSYDTESGYLTIDRTNSTPAEIPKFDRVAYTRIPGKGRDIELDIFVDKSTIEIFVNNGVKVCTLLTYAGDEQTGVSVFSMYGHTSIELTAWPLKPVWP